MVFAINCGPDGAPNSFTNFRQAALAVGASLGAPPPADPAATYGAPPPATSTWTAAYGGYTIPPPQSWAEVTQTVTLGDSTWATTYTSYANSPDPTPAAPEGVVHKVIVGGPGKLAFDPAHVVAKPRDIVSFEFRQKNHTATQSSFDDPCRKLNVNGQQIGFDSGFQPVADGSTTFPVWNLTINDTAPIWGYCRQSQPVSHCGQGMVFAINSDESGQRNFDAFVRVAKQLNGTSAGVAAPSPVTTPSGGAASLRVGDILTVSLAAVIAALL